ncbi:MAG: pyrimidine/purine nucleosidase domain-containing protein [Pseudomonadota bacterium]
MHASPIGHLELLSRGEVSKLLDTTKGGLYNLFRNCALAGWRGRGTPSGSPRAPCCCRGRRS